MKQGGDEWNGLFTELADRLQQTEEGFLSHINLSAQEIRLLDIVCQAVDNGQDNRSTAIAAARHVTAGTLTSSAKQLEKKGYLLRCRDKIDRRIVRLLPTELGRTASEQYTAFHRRMVEYMLSSLTEDEAAFLMRVVGKLSQILYGAVQAFPQGKSKIMMICRAGKRGTCYE